MCRLLGLVANKSVDLKFSLKRFKDFSKSNPNGWGIGWYENNYSNVFKQGISAVHPDSKLHTLSKEVRSNVIIAHVRKTTEGEPAERNSHPFKYNNWLFAHNGSVNRDNLLSLLSDKYKNVLEGETDSEVYFYWILQSIEDSKGDVIEGIKKAVGSITSGNCSGLNFLLSNGRCIYAFRYYKGSKDKYSLWFLRRDPSEVGELKFESDETGALLRSKLLKGERAVLVCSEKLTKKEGWQNIKCGNMLIIGSDLNTKETKIL